MDGESMEPSVLRTVEIDGVVIKPTETDVSVAADLPVDHVFIDFEGVEGVPAPEALATVADAVAELRVTVPVRADGFDPLGDDACYDALPAAAKPVFVAGHSAYLTQAERRRAIAPRLGAAVASARDPWVGTEGIERLALATGATQFSLLSPGIERDLRSLRAAGFEGDLAVYAPIVFAEDDDVVLDAIGEYVARRQSVGASLSAGVRTDAGATGRDRAILLDGCDAHALVGGTEAINTRVRELRAAGVDWLVGYPAGGLDRLGDD